MRPLCQVIVIAALSFVLASAGHSQTWVDTTPSSGPAPAARTLSAAIYDPVAHAMVVFGGQDSGGTRLNDVWSFDLATNAWTDVTPSVGGAPVGRITPASVYDGDHHQMLMFSGQAAGATFLNDTWAFDLTAKTWTQFTPPNPILAIRYGVATCYDVIGKTQVTFAGFTFQGRFDDTQRFDPVGDTWTDVTPVSTSPLQRCLHSAVYDAQKRRMIMYGGQNGGPLGDIWAFDLATETWTELTPMTGPDPRWFSTFEYDASNNRATMFSGNRSSLGKANDVWVFDLWINQWIELSPTGTPPVARDGAASVYVASEDRMVVFGGASTGVLADVWSLNNVSDTPTGIPSAMVKGAGAVLYQNVPNPFNPITTILFSLDRAQHVSLSVFDVSGKLVRTVLEKSLGAGTHAEIWDGRDDDGSPVGTGVYFYRLNAESMTLTRKAILLK